MCLFPTHVCCIIAQRKPKTMESLHTQCMSKKIYPAEELILTMTEVDSSGHNIRLRPRDQWTDWAKKTSLNSNIMKTLWTTKWKHYLTSIFARLTITGKESSSQTSRSLISYSRKSGNIHRCRRSATHGDTSWRGSSCSSVEMVPPTWTCWWYPLAVNEVSSYGAPTYRWFNLSKNQKTVHITIEANTANANQENAFYRGSFSPNNQTYQNVTCQFGSSVKGIVNTTGY